MAYVQRFEEFNDGIEISEMMPDENDDEILSPVAAAVASRGVPSLHHFKYNTSKTYNNQDPPGIHAEISCAESEISFGTEFDQVFDMEIGKVPSGKSWDDMRQILYIPSSNGGDDQSSSAEYSSIRRSGSSKCGRMRVYSNGEGSFLVPADSDLDQVFEELSEQQATEDKFLAHLTAFRNHKRSGSSGVYSIPLCSLKEDSSLEDQENSSGSEAGSVRSESYYTNSDVYEDEGLLPPPPLSSTSKLDNHQFNHRKQFIAGDATKMNENDAHLASTRLPPTKNSDDDTATTSLLSQSTYSYPPSLTVAAIPSRDAAPEVELSVSPAPETRLSASPADILQDIGSFQRTLNRRRASEHITPPRSNRVGYDPFESESALESSFDPFGRQLRTIKRPAKPRRSLLSEMMESEISNGILAPPFCADIEPANDAIDSPSMKGISKLMESMPAAPPVNDDRTKHAALEVRLEGSEETRLSKHPYLSLVNEAIADETTKDDPKANDDDYSEAHTDAVTNATDNTTIATVSEHSNDEARLGIAEAPDYQVPKVLAVDAVLQEEFGIWADMERWDEYPDDFALDQEIMNLRSPSGCIEPQKTFSGKDIEGVDEILQSRDDDSKHTATSSLSNHSETSSLSATSGSPGDKICFHDEEKDVQAASSNGETSEETSSNESELSPGAVLSKNSSGEVVSAIDNIFAPSEEQMNGQDSTISSQEPSDSEVSFAMDSGDEFDEVVSVQSALPDDNEEKFVDLFAKNEVMRSINAIADLHDKHRNDVAQQNDIEAYLEVCQQRLFTRNISHTMLQSKIAGSQTIGLILLLEGCDVNKSLLL